MDTQANKTMSVLGCGRLGSALIVGMINAKVTSAKNIVVYDPAADLTPLRSLGVYVASSCEEALHKGDTILFGVKPQVFCELKPYFLNIDPNELSQKLIVSIMAGITIEKLQGINPGCDLKLVRIMPNTPCLVNQGASVFCTTDNVSAEEKKFVTAILQGVGTCCELPECKLDAVTSVSGAGPAYVYMLAEAMVDAGIKLGLTNEVARALAGQTIVGAGKMILETGDHPASLKNNVCSPGGATICAVTEMERLGFRYSVIRAIEACHEKCEDLARHG